MKKEEFYYKIKDNVIFIEDMCYENCYYYGLQVVSTSNKKKSCFEVETKCFLFHKDIIEDKRCKDCLLYFRRGCE